MIWSGALMLDFLGNGEERYRAAHDGILQAIERVIAQGPITPDLGGKGSTQDVGKAIADRL
jgi:tartrate dehydrogenase/decarboxylase/D-malate dehydrogenase